MKSLIEKIQNDSRSLTPMDWMGKEKYVLWFAAEKGNLDLYQNVISSVDDEIKIEKLKEESKEFTLRLAVKNIGRRSAQHLQILKEISADENGEISTASNLVQILEEFDKDFLKKVISADEFEFFRGLSGTKRRIVEALFVGDPEFYQVIPNILPEDDTLFQTTLVGDKEELDSENPLELGRKDVELSPEVFDIYYQKFIPNYLELLESARLLNRPNHYNEARFNEVFEEIIESVKEIESEEIIGLLRGVHDIVINNKSLKLTDLNSTGRHLERVVESLKASGNILDEEELFHNPNLDPDIKEKLVNSIAGSKWCNGDQEGLKKLQTQLPQGEKWSEKCKIDIESYIDPEADANAQEGSDLGNEESPSSIFSSLSGAKVAAPVDAAKYHSKGK